MSYPIIASGSKTTNDFLNMDQRIRGAQAIVQELRNNSVSNDTIRNDLLKCRAKLLNAVNAINAYAAYGTTALEVAREELREPTLAAADITIIATHGQTLADWIQTAIPDGSAGTVYNQTTGQYEEATFTPAQMDGFRTRADIYLGNFT